jgi:sigma-B regulation protein RsbU (phosphoserine phosphatase)
MKAPDPHPNSKETILLVDDTPDNLRLLSQILAERDYKVRAATNGERALQTARLDPPDLILLDIRMPGINGFEVCVSLKLNGKTRDIPVIFISALDDVADKVKAFEVGGVDYITKPFQYEEVIARVETHLALRRLQLELERSNRRMTQELALAGEVQATFMPEQMPEIDGWQFSVKLKPARQMSGDFFDMFTLPDDRLAILVADVVDKGVGAALFMSLSYALFRTFAQQHPGEPEKVFEAMNNHILHDTNANQFVTVFYGILDTDSGVMIYSNAGHPPPLIAAEGYGRMARWLANTGVPLGIMAESSWQRREVLIAPQDVLFLYTDGVIEAEADPDSPFGMDRLLNSAKPTLSKTAAAIKDGVIADIRRFVGDRPLVDDLILLVIKRD